MKNFDNDNKHLLDKDNDFYWSILHTQELGRDDLWRKTFTYDIKTEMINF